MPDSPTDHETRAAALRADHFDRAAWDGPGWPERPAAVRRTYRAARNRQEERAWPDLDRLDHEN